MKTITKFKAIDGKEFTNKEECIEYELLIEKVNNIISLLNSIHDDDNCNFSNGEGFIQHDKLIVRNVVIQILELSKKYINHQWIQQTIDDESAHLSYVGRLIDDYNIRPIKHAWSRLMCIDKLGREWGQPYYANNPDKGKLICLNIK